MVVMFNVRALYKAGSSLTCQQFDKSNQACTQNSIFIHSKATLVQPETTINTLKMKSTTFLASLLATAFAAPTPSSPVGGLKYDLITRDEILARLATSPAEANDVLAKRTPGNVRLFSAPGYVGLGLTLCADLHVYRRQLEQYLCGCLDSLRPVPDLLHHPRAFL